MLINMARKRLNPMDINEYYQTMGARPESDLWEMPFYNTPNHKPVTGPARPATVNSGNFSAPAYNYQGNPILSNKDVPAGPAGSPVYQIQVIRPGTRPGQQFKPPVYNDSAGKPVLNDNLQDSAGNGVYRPSQLKKSGSPNLSARKESILGWGETRKVFLNSSFSADAPGAPLPIGNFTRIAGLEAEWELETYREGGDNGGEHIFPSQIKNSRLVFEYGTGFMDPLLIWFNTIQTGVILKLPLLIYLYNESRLPIKLWMAMNAMPVKYTAPQLDSMASEVAITRLEFIHSGLISVL